VLVRHAHRDKPRSRLQDNGLSRKGERQAKALAVSLERHLDGANARVVTSPLKRCVQTAAPIAAVLKTEAERSVLLIEECAARGAEDSMDRRIGRFCELWRKGNDEVVVAVGHGDWIPRCIRALVGAEVELKKGAWAEIALEKEKAVLSWLVQAPKEILG
jgi:broad specificity phosphatase PhoE